MQQFAHLSEYFDIRIAIPVSFIDWYKKKNLSSSQDNYHGPERWIFPYFFTPRILRGLYPLMMKWSLYGQIFSRIKKFQPQYVFGSWLYPDGIVAADIAGKLNIPYVLKAHGSDINVYLDNAFRGKSIINACEKSRKIIVVSQALKNILTSRGLQSSKIDVLYNGVDASLFYPCSVEKNSTKPPVKNILYVGNLKYDKGVMELLEAFSILPDRHNYRLTIAGGGIMRNEMNAFVSAHGLSEQVNFLGSLPHKKLPELMRANDLLVLPSYREGVPNVILEATASGIPVVATDVGGIPEVVETGVNGFMVPAKDHVALKNAIEKALDYPWDAKKIASKSQCFSWHVNAQRLHEAIIKDKN